MNMEDSTNYSRAAGRVVLYTLGVGMILVLVLVWSHLTSTESTGSWDADRSRSDRALAEIEKLGASVPGALWSYGDEKEYDYRCLVITLGEGWRGGRGCRVHTLRNPSSGASRPRAHPTE